MKKNDRSIRKLPSPETIEAACSGDALAIEQILLHYDSYINKLCLRVVQDDSRRFISFLNFLYRTTVTTVKTINITKKHNSVFGLSHIHTL